MPTETPNVIVPPVEPVAEVAEPSAPATVSTAAPEVLAEQGLDPAAPGLVRVRATSDACVNGIKYNKGEEYLVGEKFAGQFSFFAPVK